MKMTNILIKGTGDGGLWRLPIDRYVVDNAWVAKNSLDTGAREMIGSVDVWL